MTNLLQSDNVFVSRLGPRCYGGLVNTLSLNSFSGSKGLFNVLTIGEVGRSERVLSSNEKRVCVALRGTLPTSSFVVSHRGPECMGSLRIQVRVLWSVFDRSRSGVCGDVHTGASASGRAKNATSTCSHNMSAVLVRGCGPACDRSLVPGVAGSTPVSHLGGSSSIGRAPVYVWSRNNTPATNRPEMSGGPKVTGYLLCQGRFRHKRDFSGRHYLPVRRFHETETLAVSRRLGGPKWESVISGSNPDGPSRPMRRGRREMSLECTRSPINSPIQLMYLDDGESPNE